MTRIPPDAEIARDKLVNYLLAPRPWDDKSRFLAQTGFLPGNWTDLEWAIRSPGGRWPSSWFGCNGRRTAALIW